MIVNVLIDIEWVEENGVASITQLAAVRVTEDWKVVKSFVRLVGPENYLDTDWGHRAYRGYSPEEFRRGVKEKNCILGFIKFLDHGDIILCWEKDTKHLLMQKVEQFLGKPLPAYCKYVNLTVYTLAKSKGIEFYGLYKVANEIGIVTPEPMHRATNDVAVLRNLLFALGYDEKDVQETGIDIPARTMDRRVKSAGILSSVEYSYVYSPASKVFHWPNCHLMLNVIDIKGCTYYQEAINGRVPCKVCHPEPNELSQKAGVKSKRKRVPLPHQTKTEVNSKQEGATLPQQIKTQVISKQEKVTLPKTTEKKVIAARLLGDKWIRISNVKIVGYCHNLIHPGKLTRRLMEEHDCLGKSCRFFEKNSESTFWVAEENRKRQKEQRKQIQQAEKKAAQELEDELTELKDLFQSYADDAGYSMLIVRLEKERPNRYKVFYASENPFADGNRFPNFLSTIKFFFPRVSINLRHIRDVDGHFVTIAEYLSRKR